jgi:hypothetical protein
MQPDQPERDILVNSEVYIATRLCGPLLGNGYTRNNRERVGSGIFDTVLAEVLYREPKYCHGSRPLVREGAPQKHQTVTVKQ